MELCTDLIGGMFRGSSAAIGGVGFCGWIWEVDGWGEFLCFPEKMAGRVFLRVHGSMSGFTMVVGV